MIALILAAPGLEQEPALVAAAGSHGLRIVRRCVDAVDLLAAASADRAAFVAVAAGLPRLSADAVERLGAARVVGLADSDSTADRLHALGVGTVVRIGEAPSATLDRLGAALPDAVVEDGVWPTDRVDAPPGGAAASSRRGRLIAVWGPMGAPGRTTVALGLAEALAERGLRTCAVDADTYAPSMALALGVVEDTSGLVVACRQAEAGALAATRAIALTRRIDERMHLLGGLPSAQRWAELRPGALERVWDACASAFDVTVVDVGFCLERDDGGTWARPRNAAALTALAAADHVVAVADASVVGAARLLGAWPSVSAAAPGVGVTVVRNRARGRDRSWSRALALGGIRARIHDLPDDAAAVARCWAHGRSLREGARRSPVRRALADLGSAVVSG